MSALISYAGIEDLLGCALCFLPTACLKQFPRLGDHYERREDDNDQEWSEQHKKPQQAACVQRAAEWSFNKPKINNKKKIELEYLK